MPSRVLKTVIVGGGRGCLAILELQDADRLRELGMEVVAIVDPKPDAPGMVSARQRGMQTLADYRDVIDMADIELILELTGDNDILADLYHHIHLGVRIIDHVSARVFWDLIALENSLRDQLETRTILENKLVADRKRAQDILDSLPDIVMVLSPDKVVRQANARFSEFCGVDLPKAIGQNCSDLFCTADASPQLGRGCPFDRAVESGSPISSVVEKTGKKAGFYEVTACPKYDASGSLVEVVETHHPVTERMLLRREIETSELRFRQFIDSAHDIISIKDCDGRYLVVNPASAALFDLEPHQLIGKSVSELYEPEVAETIAKHDAAVMERGEYSTFLEHYTIEGRDYYLQTTRFPLFDYQGNVDGVCAIARDTTEERVLQQQLLQSVKLAAVGKLAAGVAHEINNPLTGILAYAEDLLDDVEEDDPRRADYEIIIRETLRCRDIVRDLLDFSRQEDARVIAVDVNLVVRKTLDLVTKLPQFREIDLQTDLADEALVVLGDARQLQQVILNIIDKAGDATAGTGSVTIASSLDDHGSILISIQDSGPGVPESERRMIFEPFYSTKSTGGLGLALSQGIIENHGGTIAVGDSPTGGADFRIEVPLADSDAL